MRLGWYMSSTALLSPLTGRPLLDSLHPPLYSAHIVDFQCVVQHRLLGFQLLLIQLPSPLPQSEGPPHPTDELPLCDRPMVSWSAVLRQQVCPLRPAPQRLGFGLQLQPVLLQHRQFQRQQPLLDGEPRQTSSLIEMRIPQLSQLLHQRPRRTADQWILVGRLLGDHVRLHAPLCTRLRWMKSHRRGVGPTLSPARASGLANGLALTSVPRSIGSSSTRSDLPLRAFAGKCSWSYGLTRCLRGEISGCKRPMTSGLPWT